MLIGRIHGATRVLGPPPGVSTDDCSPLAIRDEPGINGTNVMTSAWHPTPAEVEALRNGAPIYLSVYGTAHPPVFLFVGE